MLVGYIRVSSENERQNTDLQYDALIKVGVDSRNIYKYFGKQAALNHKE